MFVVVVSYSKSPEEVQPYFPAHCAWLHENTKKGNFLMSGPKKSHLGGVFLTRSMSKKELWEILKDDSYFKADVADFLIIDIDAKLTATGLEKLLDS